MPTPKDVHILIPGTCERVPFHGERDLADPEIGRLSWVVQVTGRNHKADRRSESRVTL